MLKNYFVSSHIITLILLYDRIPNFRTNLSTNKSKIAFAAARSLLYLALAIALIYSLDAAPNREKRRGEGRRRGGNRRVDVNKPCWIQDVAAGTMSGGEEGACWDVATCDMANDIDISDANGQVVYRVAFCKLEPVLLLVSVYVLFRCD